MNDSIKVGVVLVCMFGAALSIVKHGVPLPPPINVEAVVELDEGLYNVLAPLNERTVVLSAELPLGCKASAAIPAEITLIVDDKFNSRYIVSQEQQQEIDRMVFNICTGNPHY